MERIKGLVIKDLLELKSYKKNFFVSLILYGLIILSNINNSDMASFGAVMIMFLFSTYAMATFNYDEKSKTDRYVLTLPLTKKEIILSKYILAILALITGAVIGIVITMILACTITKQLPHFDNLFSEILAAFVGLSFVQSIQIPNVYKYGAEKGRLQIYLIMLVVIFTVTSFCMLLPKIDMSFLNNYEFILPLVFLLIIFINYYVSYRISCRVYNKKDV